MSKWNREYQMLPAETRDAVNKLVNDIFKQETGIHGKIDPRTNPGHARKWIEIRDNVLANRQRFSRWLDAASTSVMNTVSAIPIFRSLDTRLPWIRAAQSQLGQAEIAGAKNNERVMEYIRTCYVGFDEKKIKAWESNGDSTHWCACFVNWCLQQAGIQGLGTAWAPSWYGWGRRVSGPQPGAIVLFKWSFINSPYKFDHIAFCDYKNGELKMLGGNQGRTGIVSQDNFRLNDAKYFCMPPGY